MNKILIFILLALIGCKNDVVTPISYAPVFIAITAPTENDKYYFFTNHDTVFLSNIIIGISEVELMYDSSDKHFKTDSSYSAKQDTLLKGPFHPRTLMAFEQFTRPDFVSINAPVAMYSGIRFRLNPISMPLPNGSLQQSSYSTFGEFDHKPFIYQNDSSVRVFVTFNTGAVKLDKASGFVIKLNSSKMFDPAFGGQNLAFAKDGNNDGLIQIDLTNIDGNANIARNIFSLLVKTSSCEKLD